MRRWSVSLTHWCQIDPEPLHEPNFFGACSDLHHSNAWNNKSALLGPTAWKWQKSASTPLFLSIFWFYSCWCGTFSSALCYMLPTVSAALGCVLAICLAKNTPGKSFPCCSFTFCGILWTFEGALAHAIVDAYIIRLSQHLSRACQTSLFFSTWIHGDMQTNRSIVDVGM